MSKREELVSHLEVRVLTAEDWQAVSSIYQDGIATGQATFETSSRAWDEWDKAHLSAGRLVATSVRRVVGWAALAPISSRAVYAGVAETSVYVAADLRGKQIGGSLLGALIAESEKHRIWTLLASIFPENEASLKLHQRWGFRVVGTRERIAQLNGVWRDTLLLERRSLVVGSG